jgi:predicted kinase
VPDEPARPLQRPAITADERLAQQIRTEIEAGRLPHGRKLPTTKELAAQYNASARTVTKAMQILAGDGLVISRKRFGRVVNYPQSSDDVAAQQAPAPTVFLIGGYAGSGKTELGRILARRTHWPMLDKDSTTRAVVEAALVSLGLSPHDRESETYRDVIRPAEYGALMMGMEENLECGTSCIVTAPFVAEFADEAWCNRIRSRISGMGGEAEFVWVACDADTMLSYIRKRGAARDSAKLADWPKWVAAIDLDFEPAAEYHRIDNSAGAVPLRSQAADLLGEVAL